MSDNLVEERPAIPNSVAVKNPFLTGVNVPMTQELDLAELPVTGRIPLELDGRYLRIGPNPVAADPARYHWFTGDGMLHGLRIAGGKALWYRNRWIRSAAVAAAKGGVPAPGPARGGNNVNTNVVPMGDRIVALIEAGGLPVTFSDDLETQHYTDFGSALKGAFSAHPHLDPLTGEQHAICYAASSPGNLAHVVIDRDGRLIREEPINLPHAPMIHDCAITARYVLILDFPVAFSMAAAQAGQSFPFRWNAQLPTRIGLMPRDGTQADIIWCTAPAGFAFHVVNAFDRPDGKVELDLCAFDTMFADSRHGPDARPRGLERWTIDPETQSVGIRTIDTAPQEFPRPDERHIGQPYRYAFAMGLPSWLGGEQDENGRLYRHDLWEGTRQVHDLGAGRVSGEFVFVPRSADAPEGEGWLVGLVIDAASDCSDLLIIDAMRFEDAPVAIVHLPHRIPPGFHGNWIGTPAMAGA